MAGQQGRIKPLDSKRSPKWPAFRKAFLKDKVCAACGGSKKLEAHHRMPFHLDQSLELDETNLIALCEGNKDVNCHLVIGHGFNFKGYNPHVADDAQRVLDSKAHSKVLAAEIKPA